VRAGRAWGEPAGKAALGWSVLGVQAVVNVGSAILGLPLPTRLLISSIGTTIYVVALLPHTLAWFGRAGTRLYWPAIVAWLAACGTAAAALGTGREFRTVMSPISGLLMCVVTALALATRVKQAPDSLRRQDWYWILTGQLLFFAIEIFRKPIVEAVMQRNWDATYALSYSFSVMYSICHLIVAWGVLQRAAVRPPRTFPPASLASPV
jgi:hypothetical protein